MIYTEIGTILFKTIAYYHLQRININLALTQYNIGNRFSNNLKKNDVSDASDADDVFFPCRLYIRKDSVSIMTLNFAKAYIPIQ